METVCKSPSLDESDRFSDGAIGAICWATVGNHVQLSATMASVEIVEKMGVAGCGQPFNVRFLPSDAKLYSPQRIAIRLNAPRRGGRAAAFEAEGTALPNVY
jgi:hypothetical protein